MTPADEAKKLVAEALAELRVIYSYDQTLFYHEADVESLVTRLLADNAAKFAMGFCAGRRELIDENAILRADNERLTEERDALQKRLNAMIEGGRFR